MFEDDCQLVASRALEAFAEAVSSSCSYPASVAAVTNAEMLFLICAEISLLSIYLRPSGRRRRNEWGGKL